MKRRVNERLHYEGNDFLQEKDVLYYVILLMYVIAHLEICFCLFRDIKLKSRYKILQIPLNFLVLSVLLGTPLIRGRENGGHIHYNTKEFALMVMRELGNRGLGYFYTASTIGLPSKSAMSPIARLPIRFLSVLSRDLAFLSWGGCSLMVLAE
ncbi:MAG: hypothetical protein PVJ36_02645 [Nitrospirota bacterium]|jgi:hypothetical protein